MYLFYSFFPRFQYKFVINKRASLNNLIGTCSFGACCEHSLYECGIQMVGIFKISVKQLFGREPAKFGITWILSPWNSSKICSTFPNQILFKLVLDASKLMPFSVIIFMSLKPCWSRWSLKDEMTVFVSVPTTNLSWHSAFADGWIAFTGTSISPDFRARIENEFHPNVLNVSEETKNSVIDVMKSIGASAYDIARYKYQWRSFPHKVKNEEFKHKSAKFKAGSKLKSSLN